MDMFYEELLNGISSRKGQIIIIHDPDGFFSEVTVSELFDGSIDVHYFNDPDLFRYEYERDYRQRRDNGTLDKVFMVICSNNRGIPYDVLSKGSLVDMELSRIFPLLDSRVIRSLNPSLLTLLYDVYSRYNGGKMTADETLDFIISEVFNLSIDKIKGVEDLISALLNLMYQDKMLPPDMIEYIIRKQRINIDPEYISDKTGLMEYLQNQWAKFVSGEESIDFDRLKLYMDNLFTDGYLRPLEVENMDGISSWMAAGVYVDRAKTLAKRMLDITRRLESLLADARSYKDWFDIAGLWAEVSIIRHDGNIDTGVASEFERVRDDVETKFADWLLKRYGSLPYLSYVSGPVMVHHIPWYLKSRAYHNKIALIVMDGMSLSDWTVIESCFKDKEMRFHDGKCFAWIPTITPISRRAIFSGQIPMNFIGQAFSTYPEGKEWARFWSEAGFGHTDIAYYKFIDVPDKLESLNYDADIIGVVIDAVDNLAHSSKLSIDGLHENLRLWMKNGRLERFIRELMEKSFDVYLTSDHGNVAAVGTGMERGGYVPDIDGERVRVYNRVSDSGNNSGHHEIRWPGYGLPQGYVFYVMEGNGAYARSDQPVVGHGGISIEEVIVPFVHLRKDA